MLDMIISLDSNGYIADPIEHLTFKPHGGLDLDGGLRVKRGPDLATWPTVDPTINQFGGVMPGIAAIYPDLNANAEVLYLASIAKDTVGPVTGLQPEEWFRWMYSGLQFSEKNAVGYAGLGIGGLDGVM